VSTTQETSADRVRDYLGRLTPKARSNLLTDIERMQLYGEDTSAFAAILAELRAEFRRGSEPANRIGNPSRHFFKPIEDLFADRSPERANSGRYRADRCPRSGNGSARHCCRRWRAIIAKA
jgi:hypothetical protein